VSLFVVGRGRQRWEVPYTRVTEISIEKNRGIRINATVGDLRELPRRPSGEGGEHLLVSKDLLDQQIIDVDGRKVVRVNDVHFQRSEERRVGKECRSGWWREQ